MPPVFSSLLPSSHTNRHKMLSAPWCRPSSSSSTPRGLRSMTPPPPALAASKQSNSNIPPTNLPYQVGLLDLTVPSKRTGTGTSSSSSSSSGSSGSSYTNLLLANDICIEKAVQYVSETLYSYLREDPAAVAVAAAAASLPPSESALLSPTTPELRVYLSELYGQLWDVCYLHKNLPLDVRILYNTTEPASSFSSFSASAGAGAVAAATASTTLPPAPPVPAPPVAEPGKKDKKDKKDKSSKKKGAALVPPASSSSLESQSLQRQGNIPTSWEEALLKPELQVVFTQHKNADSEELSNAKREALVSECG